MIATVLTVGLHGLKPYLVRVTATKANRQGSCVITGLTECVRRETWVRVSSAPIGWESMSPSSQRRLVQLASPSR